MDKVAPTSKTHSSPPQKQKSLISNHTHHRFFSVGVLGAMLFFLAERTDSHRVAFVFKPIPIYCLIAWIQWNNKNPKFCDRMIQVGLFFGSIGDLLLSSKIEDSFIYGLLAFLVGHIFYATAFRMMSTERRILPQLLHLLPFLCWCCTALWYMRTFGNTDSLFVPLCGYTSLLLTICWLSSLATLDRHPPSNLPLQLWFWQKFAPVIGAVFFTTSDMMIAFDKFLPNFHSTSTTRLIYMILYYVGQTAIAYSTL